ncbi:hypothetical protein ACWED2_10160 [Amycolatopsis sp. NPDC005003]
MVDAYDDEQRWLSAFSEERNDLLGYDGLVPDEAALADRGQRGSQLPRGAVRVSGVRAALAAAASEDRNVNPAAASDNNTSYQRSPSAAREDRNSTGDEDVVQGRGE